MVYWKAWFDVRQRFFLVVALWMVLIGGTHVVSAVASTRSGAVAEDARGAAAHGFDASVTDWTTGQAQGTFSILAVLLAVGGLLGRPSGQSDLLTLSLPPSRSRWLRAQAGMALVLLLALGVLEVGTLVLTAVGFGLAVPLGPVLAGCLVTPLSAAIWIWPTILLMAFFRDSMRASIAGIAVVVGVASLAAFSGSGLPFFRPLADVTRWTTGVPWSPLLVGLALSVVTAWWAQHRFEEMEF